MITEKTFSDSTNRVQNAMIHNPIYDGPVYESVQPHFDTLTAATQQALASSTTSADKSLCTTTPPALQNKAQKANRYIDQPSQQRCQSFSQSSPTDNNTPRSGSVSIPKARVMALKKNGRERNKLHLTLTLNGSDPSPTTCVPKSDGSSVTLSGTIMCANPAVADENYMVMSPITGSLNAKVIELSPEDTAKYKE